MAGGEQSAALNSINHPFRRIGQFFPVLLGIQRRRVQVLMPENLGTGHKVVVRVGQEPMGEGVPQQMGVQLHPDDGGVLVAQRPNPSVSQRATFADEHLAGFCRGAGGEVRLNCSSGGQGQRDAPLLAALAVAEGHWASASSITVSDVPRSAISAVYNALIAAAEFFELRNSHQAGFNYDSPVAIYRAYEQELYRFDQLYRQFCEAADRAEAEQWDILKKLRSDLEASYANWFLTTVALAWGKFVDPQGTSR